MSIRERRRAEPWPSEVLIVSDAGSLSSWRRILRSFTRTRDLPLVAVQLPALSTEHNRSVSAAIERHLRECGCAAGGFLMSAVLALTVLRYLLTGGRVADVDLGTLGTLVGVVTVAALVGKLVGLLWARWQLIRISGRLAL